MYWTIIRNDIRARKVESAMIALFVAAAAMLVSLASILIFNLAGAIDSMMERSKTPHFLQMHSGNIDETRLRGFVRNNPNIEAFQVLPFLNIDGAQITIGGRSFADNLQDNGLCTQSDLFDYLLNLNGDVIQPVQGEIYVPISYRTDAIQIGSNAVICGREFIVAGFVRDSQMNSPLASSKRFLVSKEDYAQIRGFGKEESLIEFRLYDLSGLSSLEKAYTTAALESNGPTITYPLFKMMNALSDGLMIVVILLVSILIVAIAFLCIRFTLQSKVEDDMREIGVMRAIGLRMRDIKRVYLATYAAIAAAGCAVGFALSFAFRGMLLKGIRLSMGESQNNSLAPLFGFLCVLLVFAAILVYVNGIFKRYANTSAVQALHWGTTCGARSTQRMYLSENRFLPTNVFLGVKDVFARKKLYTTMLVVLSLCAFIAVVPQNLHNTIADKSFSEYMGIGACDLRIDIQQTDHIAEKAADIEKTLQKDADIERYVILKTRAAAILSQDGSQERIKVELGDHSVFPVRYSQGRLPSAQDEIALSALNASALNKQVGDPVSLILDAKIRECRVCGIYSDVTNGGKTSKAVLSDDSPDLMWCVICVKLKDPSLSGIKAQEYGQAIGYAKVCNIQEYIAQTFGATVLSIQTASRIAMTVALLIVMLITLLFVSMLIIKDRDAIAVLKSVGFTSVDVRIQYVARSILVSILGVALGILLANTLGEVLVGAVISSLGASSFRFVVNPLTAYVMTPLLMACAAYAATRMGTKAIELVKKSDGYKE